MNERKKSKIKNYILYEKPSSFKLNRVCIVKQVKTRKFRCDVFSVPNKKKKFITFISAMKANK